MRTDILQLPLRRALVSVETAKAALDKSEDQILALVEDGSLRFAWNFSSRNSRRRLVRIFALSLADLANATNHQPMELADAIKYLLPGSEPALHASRLASSWSIGGTHLADLILERSLEKVRPGRHATDSPLISRASAVKFLTLRRLS